MQYKTIRDIRNGDIVSYEGQSYVITYISKRLRLISKNFSEKRIVLGLIALDDVQQSKINPTELRLQLTERRSGDQLPCISLSMLTKIGYVSLVKTEQISYAVGGFNAQGV